MNDIFGVSIAAKIEGMRNAECGIRNTECGMRNGPCFWFFEIMSLQAQLVKPNCTTFVIVFAQGSIYPVAVYFAGLTTY